MSTESPITKKGLDKITKELEHLIKVEREELKRVIQEARELGDLKENAEYHAAKEKQATVEGRIMQLQGVIASARVVDVASIVSDKVVFGATVTLTDTDKGTQQTVKIVGEFESDSAKRHISFTSPLGRALIGKEEGDTAIVKAPKGNVEYEIDSIEFIED